MDQLRTENYYLLNSNRDKASKLLVKLSGQVSPASSEIMNFFIALHFVLEIGLNIFFREITLEQPNKKMSVKKQIKATENLDKISLIHKVISFIHFSDFDFNGNDSIAEKHYSVIGRIRDFCEIRNKLMHGHFNGSIQADQNLNDLTFGKNEYSKTHKLINRDYIYKQIDLFESIFDSISFYFDHMKTSFDENEKKYLKISFLKHGFLTSI